MSAAAGTAFAGDAGALPGARPLTAIGLMSGTSLDGIDAALIVSDGLTIASRGDALTVPYPAAFRSRLRRLLGRAPEPSDAAVILELTDRHAEAVERLLAAAGLTAAAIDVVGFHGQTVLHEPAMGRTIQIGRPARLARRLQIAVVADFRAADIAAGGQGAPLVPLYHAALARNLAKPVAVLNLGGVGNLTWIGGETENSPLLAFDTGPGNALIDDWVRARTGRAFDEGGRLAATGRLDADRLAGWLDHPYFRQPPPKSLDRDAFAHVLADAEGLGTADGAATITALTAAAAAAALPWLPVPPRRWLVGGGGRRNPALMRMLQERLSAAGAPVAVEPVEALGWRGDALEAEAFAFLAVRSVRGLPLSLPTTTGVPRPQPGGRLVLPPTRQTGV